MNYQIATFEKAFGTAEQLPVSDLPEVCFAGRSNVGKSSLINKILGRKSLARISSKPGKTVTVNFYKLDGLRLVDLPGYGYAKVPFSERDRWSELMETYFRMGREIRMTFQLVDMRHPLTDFDHTMLDFLGQMGLPCTVVLTKCDKLNRTEFAERLKNAADELSDYDFVREIVPFSAIKGDGVEKLREILEKSIE